MESVPNSKPWGKSFDASLSILLLFNFGGTAKYTGDFHSFTLAVNVTKQKTVVTIINLYATPNRHLDV
jgi:hypothetical protein